MKWEKSIRTKKEKKIPISKILMFSSYLTILQVTIGIFKTQVHLLTKNLARILTNPCTSKTWTDQEQFNPSSRRVYIEGQS